MKKLILGVCALLTFANGCMNGPEQAADVDPSAPARGEYVVTASGGPDSSNWEYLFSGFGIKEVKYLGSRTFLVCLNDDPGLQRMQRVGSRSKAIVQIQPNFIYQLKGNAKAADSKLQ
jgi:hypothetical protein